MLMFSGLMFVDGVNRGGVASVYADVTQAESANDRVRRTIIQPKAHTLLLHRKYAG